MKRDTPEIDITRSGADMVVGRGHRWEYVTASSLVAHLIRKHGIAKFLRLYESRDDIRDSLGEIYAMTVQDAENEWKERLSMICGLLPSMQRFERLKHEQKIPDAIEQLEVIIGTCGDEPILLLEKGALLVLAGQFEDAIQVLRNALSNHSIAIEPLWLLGSTHYSMGQAYEALAYRNGAKHHFEEAAGLGLDGRALRAAAISRTSALQFGVRSSRRTIKGANRL
jgi:tetratricopeptide (TPR) repeat protein